MTTEKAILEAREQRKDEADDAGVAAALLGKMYWRGEGYVADELQALNWFKKGALLVRYAHAASHLSSLAPRSRAHEVL